MNPESEGFDHLERRGERGERWEAIVHSRPDQPAGDVGATVHRIVRGAVAESYEFSFDRGRDVAGDIYRALPFSAPPGRLRARAVNRARYEAGTVLAEATGTRVSAGPIFPQRYLDALAHGAEGMGDEERGGELESPPETAQRGGSLDLTDEQLGRFRHALQDVTEALEAGDREHDTLEELDDGQLTRIADGLDAALAVLDEAAGRDGERRSIAG